MLCLLVKGTRSNWRLAGETSCDTRLRLKTIEGYACWQHLLGLRPPGYLLVNRAGAASWTERARLQCPEKLCGL